MALTHLNPKKRINSNTIWFQFKKSNYVNAVSLKDIAAIARQRLPHFSHKVFAKREDHTNLLTYG